MSAQHTPGPWTIYTGSDAEEHRRGGWVLVMARGNAGRIVANVNAEGCPEISSAPAPVKMPADANARLIAAAPELLEALKKTYTALRTLHDAQQWDKKQGEDYDAAVDAETQARAAIAKATGGEQ